MYITNFILFYSTGNMKSFLGHFIFTASFSEVKAFLLQDLISLAPKFHNYFPLRRENMWKEKDN